MTTKTEIILALNHLKEDLTPAQRHTIREAVCYIEDQETLSQGAHDAYEYVAKEIREIINDPDCKDWVKPRLKEIINE